MNVMVDDKRKELGQFFTHSYVAQLLIERHFSKLGRNDLVVEPSCGDGAFLAAIPRHVPAIGVEYDPKWAPIARRNSGREVICGDFREVRFDGQVTNIIGNPPFSMKIVDGFLDRAAQLLPENGRVGLILPAYMFQTASTVMRMNESWSIFQEMLPRTIFGANEGEELIKKPVVFAIFTKDQERKLFGFGLYEQVHQVSKMQVWAQKILREYRGSVWREVVIKALGRLGGEASIESIYGEVSKAPPSATQWGREQVRKVLGQRPFERRGDGVYGFCELAL